MDFSLEELLEAQKLVYRHMAPTPAYAWPLLAEEFGCTVWVKHENHTPTGAFKVRGGIVFLDQLVRRSGGDPPDLITATRGNHGQSIPFAARRHGIPVTVLVPEGNSRDKNAAMRAWGAELVVHGSDFDASREEAERRAAASNAVLVPSFHPDLVRGVASYGLELFEQAGRLDTVYVPVGMGSGICSLIAVRDALALDTEIVGVVAAGADGFARSFAAGEPVAADSPDTFADGMAVRVTRPDVLEIVRRGAARIVTVTDAEIADAMRRLYRTTHNVAEGAGAAACAAAWQEREHLQGGHVAVVLTGGNVDPDVFGCVLGGGTPEP